MGVAKRLESSCGQWMEQAHVVHTEGHRRVLCALGCTVASGFEITGSFGSSTAACPDAVCRLFVAELPQRLAGRKLYAFVGCVAVECEFVCVYARKVVFGVWGASAFFEALITPREKVPLYAGLCVEVLSAAKQ